MATITIERTGADRVPAERRAAARAATNVLALSALATLAIAFVLLVPFDGWTYYRTPRTVRGYAAAHRLLRPSGAIGQALGIVGFALMLVPMLYTVRKKSARLASFGSMRTWLQVHIFCGIVGPVAVTFHTSFKFNGIVSVAYWLMVIVASSGFVGRYLYVRIPRSVRGTELSLQEGQARAAQMQRQLADAGLPAWLLERIVEVERRAGPGSWPGAWLVSLFFGDAMLRLRLQKLARDLRATGLAREECRAVVALISARALLLRRLVLLDRTKRLFDLWHILHQPLVYFLFAIVVLHVGVVTYMGYSVFSKWMAP